VTHVTYVGHATVLLEVDSVRLLTDPLLRARVFHLRRHVPAGMEALDRIDVVLVSHAHWDHLDLPSLRRVAGGASTVVVPRGCARHLRRVRFAEVVEIDAGEEVTLSGLTVVATHAEHHGRRLPFGDATPSLGYVVSGSTSTYFAGDTDLFTGMSALAPLDLALLPIAGWGSRLPAGHLDPRGAAEALRLLRPRVAVPIHWGTYSAMSWRQPRPRLDTRPAAEFERHAAELAPEVDVRVLAPGESLEIASA
jgi:L-ascorbate metabolism protein UlaG (beta-lactamase superfamily)